MRKNTDEYAPFDALRGLGTVLRERERRLLPRGSAEEKDISGVLRSIACGTTVTVVYSWRGEYASVTGPVEALSRRARRLRVCSRDIAFEDIIGISAQYPL
ncbi:MAG: hypothetical protein IK083_08080 [Abditibacteriota bacterium]|jgi:hypothetical protein|nr:hypothetical protein [Abditibacteriota bacterium]